MNQKVVVQANRYHDSAFLMRISRELKALPGMAEAVVLMGTPMNLELLEQAGFEPAVIGKAGPMDLVVALRAEDPAAIEAAERELPRLLRGADTARKMGAEARPASLAEALAAAPQANIVSVAVPGPYAAYLAHRALDAGRHVFLFSNNVPLEDEIALKQRGRQAGLLVMGPDCGTAILNGVGFGFTNRVPRGNVGLVGASGTGLQEVCCQLDALDQGVTHAIGTGSQDLSKAVGGIMTEMGLKLLQADPETLVVVLVAKHPSPEVADRIHGLLAGLGKPAVVRYLGQEPRKSADGVYYAPSLDQAAALATELIEDPDADPARVAATLSLKAAESNLLASAIAPVNGRAVGLFGGGSLMAEAQLAFTRMGLSTLVPDRPLQAGSVLPGREHLLIDTGEDFYTRGRPHPMIDQTVRCELLLAMLTSPAVGLVLLDLVLGDGAHPDPAPELVQVMERAWKINPSRPRLLVSVSGTRADPQNLERQRDLLTRAGMQVLPSAALAAADAAKLLSLGKRNRMP
jgi:FdrA protein